MENTVAPKKKKKLTKKRKKELFFIIVMLAYPVTQFLLIWIFVNFNSILLAFKPISDARGIFKYFDNFILVIETIFTKMRGSVTLINGWEIPTGLLVLINSLSYAFVAIFISLPLALVSSYFLSKKMPLANVFRVIFFLPNIISVVALIFAFRMQLDSNAGAVYFILKNWFNITIKDAIWPNTTIIVLLYCIWAGLGYNVLLLSGAIGRIPKELFESAKMDGAGSFKEFTKIMIPMVWPTVVTLIVVGMTSILTLYLQPVIFDYVNTETIAGSIFNEALNESKRPYLSAFGLFFSLIFAPLILWIRKVLSKRYSDVDI